MSASGWLIMAVRTCNPFQWETNAATVLSSPKRPGPRATSPPAWSQYLDHREGTLGSGDVWTHCNLLRTWWDEQKRRISTKLYGTLYWFCTSFLYLTVNSWRQVAQLQVQLVKRKWSSYKKKQKTKHLFIFLKKKGFKRSLWKDFRWQRSFLSDWYQTSSACSCFSQWTSCHVPTWW